MPKATEVDGGRLITITRARYEGMKKAITRAREEWLENNPPEKEGVDIVTPYDHFLYVEEV